jgi:NTP pyrophosphatase (non-canonical NTP hydrolase)
MDKILSELKQRYADALKKHPEQWKAQSPHQVLGVVTEEYHEFIEAVRKNDLENQKDELFDIMIGCLWGIFSAPNFEKKEKFGRGVRKD